MVSVAFSVSFIESSLHLAMLILSGILPSFMGSLTADGIFSIAPTFSLNHFRRWFRGPACLLILLMPWWLMYLYSRCSLGSTANLISARWHHLLTISTEGRMCAYALSKSVAEVLSPPMMARAPALCIIAVWSSALTSPNLVALAPSTHETMH